MTGSTSAADPLFQMMTVSTAPSPSAARKMATKFSIFPITAAVRARSRIAGPKADPSGRPMIPARRISVIDAMSVAMIHATLCVSPT